MRMKMAGSVEGRGRIVLGGKRTPAFAHCKQNTELRSLPFSHSFTFSTRLTVRVIARVLRSHHFLSVSRCSLPSKHNRIGLHGVLNFFYHTGIFSISSWRWENECVLKTNSSRDSWTREALWYMRSLSPSVPIIPYLESVHRQPIKEDLVRWAEVPDSTSVNMPEHNKMLILSGRDCEHCYRSQGWSISRKFPGKDGSWMRCLC